MVTNWQSKWRSRSITLAVWALAAGSVVWWGLRLAASPQPVAVPPQAATVTETVVDTDAVARLLGGAAVVDAPAAVASRFVLLGVVAGRSSQGAALISVDGKPGRPYRVGSKIEEGVFLQAVEPRRARLAPAASAPASVVLEMPLKK